MTHYAHTDSNRPKDQWHLLERHLVDTAERCREFCRRFGAQWGYLAGLLHDLGKYQPAFQQYLLASSSNCKDARKAPHAAAGALWAYRRGLRPIAGAIQSHHGFLKPRSEVKDLQEDDATVQRLSNSEKLAPAWLVSEEAPLPPEDWSALWTRFLFSALVDADSLDTERFYTGQERPMARVSLADLLAKLETELQDKQRGPHADSEMNRLRREVQQHTRNAALREPGAFRLTVPTGGGKTFASLLFALRHAVQNNLDRVIVVIPYTSIIDQTAAEYRRVLGDDAVLEHHSNLDPEDESPANRLASENWDRPVVVTTSVQFFETLFANHKRRLRKLHRVAGSVVVLDEVQTLPLDLLIPIQGAMTQLRRRFQVSVVHCTATQPLLLDEGATEIVPDAERLFEVSRRRVAVRWPEDTNVAVSWGEIARRIADEPSGQVLAIVNKRADAIQLATLLGEDCIHLSALMCAEHRRTVLAGINRKLAANEPCLVVATQLVEAGVDLDFPIVYRAMAGFDSLAQAAGRCNREGRRGTGRLEVFVAEGTEPRYLRPRTLTSRKLLRTGLTDLFDPQAYVEYFRDLKRGVALDAHGIQTLEEKHDFPAVDKKFQMIEESGAVPVVAPWGDWQSRVEDLRQEVTASRLRALQPYVVSMHPGEIEKLKSMGAITPLLPILLEPAEVRSWLTIAHRADSIYDSRFGFGRASLASVRNSFLNVD